MIRFIVFSTITLFIVKLANNNVYSWEVLLYPICGFVFISAIFFIGWVFSPSSKEIK